MSLWITQWQMQRAQLQRMQRQIDAIVAHLGIEVDENDQEPDPSQEVIDLIAAGKDIAAVKAHRIATGAGLRASKEYVDRLRAG